ncbi:MAG TPA: type II toxin-antitoxin system VapC family toxin [Dehalococcoidia bacterium]|nr:type II toxin-antitoxin system VapC family toxin [Dehalococcoidia bacterium]
MPHLIDSDHVIQYLDQRPMVIKLINSLAPTGIWISIITYMEVYQGIQRQSTVQELRDGFDAFILVAPVLPFSIAVAERCATIRETLRQQGRRTRSRYLDLITAATAIEYDLTLVTRNTADYRDVPGLKLL